MKIIKKNKYFATVPVKNNYSLGIGDHIYYQGSLNQHHGIVSEVDRYGRPVKVIEFQTPNNGSIIDQWNPAKAKVREQTYEGWSGKNVYHVQDSANTRYKGEAAVKRARLAAEMANNPQSVFANYNLRGNNCEHFATFIKNGRKGRYSAQVNTVENAIGGLKPWKALGITEGFVDPNKLRQETSKNFGGKVLNAASNLTGAISNVVSERRNNKGIIGKAAGFLSHIF